MPCSRWGSAKAPAWPCWCRTSRRWLLLSTARWRPGWRRSSCRRSSSRRKWCARSRTRSRSCWWPLQCGPGWRNRFGKGRVCRTSCSPTRLICCPFPSFWSRAGALAPSICRMPSNGEGFWPGEATSRLVWRFGLKTWLWSCTPAARPPNRKVWCFRTVTWWPTPCRRVTGCRMPSKAKSVFYVWCRSSTAMG